MIEALALGLPVVATDVGGISDLLGDGDDAVLVPPARPDLLAKAIVDIVTDDAVARRDGRAAVARRPELGVAHAVHEMEQIYVEASSR